MSTSAFIRVETTKNYQGIAYEWRVTDNGHFIGNLLRDSEGTWYGQTPKADFQRFEDPEMHEDDRRAAAIAWLVEQDK